MKQINDSETNKESMKQNAHRAKEKAKPWIFKYARAGHLAKGLIYFIIGLLASMPVIGINGKFTSAEGAIYTIAKQPFGYILVFILAIGFLGFAIWEGMLVAFGTDTAKNLISDILQRIGYAFLTLVYLVLSFNTFRILFHAQINTSGQKYQQATSVILKYPFGQWMVALVGAVFIGAGIGQCIWALSGRFQKRLKQYEMSKNEYRVTAVIGRVGYTARSIIFMVIGFFLILSAWQADPNKTKGMDGALAILIKQPYGKGLLGAVAGGLMIFGIYMCMEARFKRMTQQKGAL